MKSLVVSVCITAVTDMAAVSLLVFFWCSSGFFWVLLVFFCVIEHQKNTRRTPEEPRRTQKNPEEHQKNIRRETAAMSVTAVIQTETTSAEGYSAIAK